MSKNGFPNKFSLIPQKIKTIFVCLFYFGLAAAIAIHGVSFVFSLFGEYALFPSKLQDPMNRVQILFSVTSYTFLIANVFLYDQLWSSNLSLKNKRRVQYFIFFMIVTFGVMGSISYIAPLYLAMLFLPLHKEEDLPFIVRFIIMGMALMSLVISIFFLWMWVSIAHLTMFRLDILQHMNYPRTVKLLSSASSPQLTSIWLPTLIVFYGYLYSFSQFSKKKYFAKCIFYFLYFLLLIASSFTVAYSIVTKMWWQALQ